MALREFLFFPANLYLPVNDPPSTYFLRSKSYLHAYIFLPSSASPKPSEYH